MADQPPSNESDEQATIAWLESEGVVTTSAQPAHPPRTHTSSTRARRRAAH